MSYYYKKQIFEKIFLLVILLALFACQATSDEAEVINVANSISPLERLPDNEAGEIVKKAIDYVGGWEAWANKKSFSFYKNIEHRDATGKTERTQRQLHEYQLYPFFQARMSWEDGGDQYMIINNGEEAEKYKNGKVMTDDNSKKQAWNSSFGSNYVISMPFKLTDPGVILNYEGIDTIATGQAVHSLKVEYEKGAGSSGGFHTWWYYFDLETYDMAANFLDYGDKYSLTTYETFTKVDDLRVHQKRYSYISNANKELVQLRTIYTNEAMQFDPSFDESHFQLK